MQRAADSNPERENTSTEEARHELNRVCLWLLGVLRPATHLRISCNPKLVTVC